MTRSSTRPESFVGRTTFVGFLALVAVVPSGCRPPAGGATAATDSPGAEILAVPFELRNHHIVIPVSVNGSSAFEVVLDSGFPTPGLALYDGPRVAALGLTLDPSMQTSARGAGGSGDQFAVKVAPRESFDVGGARFAGLPILVLPDLGIGSYHEGIVGASLLSRFVVELDFESRVMRLHEPELHEKPAEALELSLEFQGGVPYTTVTVTPYGGGRLPLECTWTSAPRTPCPSTPRRSKACKVPAGSPAAIVGRGISGLLHGHVGRIAKLDIAGAAMEGVVTSFPSPDHQNPRGLSGLGGNLGTGVLSRFTTTMDYFNDRMLLVPNGRFEDEFRFDRSGLRLTPADTLKIEGIIAGSPADRAGLEPGDVLIRIDDRPVTGADFESVRARLLGDGEVSLVYARDGAEVAVVLVLTDLIPDHRAGVEDAGRVDEAGGGPGRCSPVKVARRRAAIPRAASSPRPAPPSGSRACRR